MSLVLECRPDSRIPIEVDGILPERLRDFSEQEIAAQSIWLGSKPIQLGELFRVRGRIDENETIVWQGNLQTVHWIGAQMSRGKMLVESATGRHVGRQMSGGTIVVQSDVSDFAGCEMTGGTLRIHGNTGDLLGGPLPGSTFGMNRGTIMVDGNAGRGVGQAMRRGTIAIGGNAGRLCGWNMLAGTIAIVGKCGADYGVGMIRGTLLVGQSSPPPPPTFARGGIYHDTMIRMLSNWLSEQGFDAARQLSQKSFQMFHGDLLNGGRGEVLLVA